MILAFDTCYNTDKAHTACIAFRNWDDPEPAAIYTELLEGVAAYEPGAFYKRELPCMLSLLKQIPAEEIQLIIVDGFVFLDDAYKPGLGAHLYQALKETIPVIGVAKTNFATIEQLKRLVYRGDSQNPLYITAVGIDTDLAAEHIRSMYGPFRIPALLKLLDQWSRKGLEEV